MGELQWIRVSQLMASVKTKKRVLIFYIGKRGKKFYALALEVLAKQKNPEAVLAHHAHQYLGSYSSFEKADEACLKNALFWLKDQPRREQCSCKELGLVTRRRRSSVP